MVSLGYSICEKETYEMFGYTPKLAVCSDGEDPSVNLGLIRKRKNQEAEEDDYEEYGIIVDDSDISYRTSFYCGMMWLKDEDGNYVTQQNGERVLLKVNPYVELSYETMLSEIALDDEFDLYMAFNKANPKDKIITFFQNEDMIPIDSSSKDEFKYIKIYSFLMYLQSIVRRPLYKEMQKFEDNFVGKVKGKININKNIRKNSARGRVDSFCCNYMQQTENNAANQLLKYVLKYCRKNEELFESSPDWISIYNRCMKAFQHVDDKKFKASDIKSIRIPNMYSYYKSAFRIAKMLLSESKISITPGQSSTLVPAFAINVSRLYECYVRTLIKKSINQVKNETKISEDGSKEPKTYYPTLLPFGKGLDNIADEDFYINGKVIPDIILEYEEGPEKYRIFDCKYKNLQSSKHWCREDRLQLLAYGALYDCEVIGHIAPVVNDPTQVGGIISDSKKNSSPREYCEFLCKDKDSFAGRKVIESKYIDEV